ncbi:MAG TPA: hypothetical protein VJI73_00680 [Candidatus Paceibacterota bacterium]
MKTSGITEIIFRALNNTIYDIGVIFGRGSLTQKLRKLEPGYKEWEINRALSRLERDGFLEKRKGGISVTTRGKERVSKYAYKHLSFNPPSKKCNPEWILIIFDIPESKRNLRKLFREKIKEWNCTKIQQSVFISPFDCGKEIWKLVIILRIQPFVRVFKILDSEKLLSKYCKN